MFKKFYSFKAKRINFKRNITTYESTKPINFYIIYNVKFVHKAKFVYRFNMIFKFAMKIMLINKLFSKESRIDLISM